MRPLLAGLLCAIFIGIASCAEAPVVSISSGRVQGVVQGNTVAYLGIPYAAAPTGNLRWRAPAPAPQWTDVRETTRFGANCPQPIFEGDPALTMSEDCLFLNVWTPQNHRADARLPVMVWIHGGAYIFGSGDIDDASAFTRDGVVLVSINYRLGRFGFFAHPALTAENADNGLLGNYGILDQIEALKWVRANIAQFGGDPDNVTIFGVSAGATFTNLLMYSPLSEGLFHRAIAQSDPFAQPWPYMAVMNRSGQNAESYGDAWAQSVGAPNATPAQLRAIPTERALADPNEANAGGVKPMVDGRIVPERGPEAFAAGLAHRVPYIIGANSYEGSLTEMYNADAAALVASLGANGPQIVQKYGQTIANNHRLLAATITGDTSFVGPRRIAARLASSHDVPTWVYHFAYVPEALRETLPGAPHASEVSFAFEDLGMYEGSRFDARAADKAMARQVHSYWVNFARTGDPNGAGLPNWPRFAPNETLLAFENDGIRPINGYRDDLYDLIEPSIIGDRLAAH
ncbi:MAG: carboxylesterase family protein [Caulobacterales bacterium]